MKDQVFTTRESALFIIITVALLSVSISVFQWPAYIALAISLVILAVMTYNKGFAWSDVFRFSLKNLGKVAGVLTVLGLIGGLIGIWKASGVFANLLYWGLNWVKPAYFLLTTFIITSLGSYILGTAIGTASTFGLLFLGLGTVMGLPKGLVAGAVISGAYFGDRGSPVSGVLQLTGVFTRSNPNRLVDYFMHTGLPAWLIAAVGYYMWNTTSLNTGAGLNQIKQIQQQLSLNFTISPLLLLMPGLLIMLTKFNYDIRVNATINIVVSLLTGSLTQTIGVSGLINSIFYGNHTSMGGPLQSILSGGGLFSLVPLFYVVFVATLMSGILEETRAVESLIEPLKDHLQSPMRIIMATMLLSISTAATACNQLMSVIIPANTMYYLYHRKNLHQEVLARTLADSGVVFAGLIPWNVAALTPALILNVNVTDYVPYAFYLWLLPMMTVIFTACGWVRLLDQQG